MVTDYLQKRFIPPEGDVIDLGAGYCDFINQVKGRNRFAVDINHGLPEYAGSGVKAMVGEADGLLATFPGESIQTVFSSNFLEHLEWKEIKEVAGQVNRVLVAGGRWIIIQPNFRYAWRHYFDDYTHRTIFTDLGLAGYLKSEGFFVEHRAGRFLPLTIYSRLPKNSWLVRVYLRLPVKFLGGQFLLVVKKG